MTYEKTFTFKGAKGNGGKQSKGRLTILQCTNLTGTEKFPLFVIGKSQRSTCFKGPRTLPVDNISTKKACITKILFKDLSKTEMKIKRRQTVLLIDNYSSHTNLSVLENVRVLLLPANIVVKYVLLPLDRGI